MGVFFSLCLCLFLFQCFHISIWTNYFERISQLMLSNRWSFVEMISFRIDFLFCWFCFLSTWFSWFHKFLFVRLFFFLFFAWIIISTLIWLMWNNNDNYRAWNEQIWMLSLWNFVVELIWISIWFIRFYDWVMILIGVFGFCKSLYVMRLKVKPSTKWIKSTWKRRWLLYRFIHS